MYLLAFKFQDGVPVDAASYSVNLHLVHVIVQSPAEHSVRSLRKIPHLVIASAYSVPSLGSCSVS